MSAEHISPPIPLAHERGSVAVARRADGSARLVFRLGRSNAILDHVLDAEGVRALADALTPPLREVMPPAAPTDDEPLVMIGQGEFTRRIMPS